MTDKPKPHANQGHADPDKAGREQYKRHIDGDITVRGQIEVYVPPNAAEQRNTEREQDKASAKKNYIVSVATLIAVILYAGIAFWQGCLTRSAIDQSGKQFLLDQRPWLSVKGNPIEGRVEAGSHILVHPEIENIGKSPAIRSTTHYEMSANICPDVPYPPPSGVHLSNNPGPVTYATIFPGQSQSAGAVSYELDQPTMDRLNSGACGFYVAGVITYCDVAGISHYQHWCWKWEKRYPLIWGVCSTYEDGDQDHPEAKPKPCSKG